MNIYYSASVRSASLTKDTVKAQVNFLKNFGKVLTEHLAWDNVDGNKTDEEIFKEDQELLKECDLFIAEVSAPSLGVGFMISQALQQGKYILCLYSCPQISAMISGCPGIVRMKYSTQEEFEFAVRSFLMEKFSSNVANPKPLRIFLEGPPGSGKSSLSKLISNEFNLDNISTGALLRNIAQQNDPIAVTVKEYMSKGELVPSDLMMKILGQRLDYLSCKVNGYLLDGYPPSMEDLQNLLDLKVSPDIIFCLECPDEIAIQRQCVRGERETDEITAATKRIKIYHEKIPDFVNHAKEWFPSAFVIRINAEKSSEEVWNIVRETINNYLKAPEHSYFLSPPFDWAKPTKFHFHIDTNTHENLRRIASKIHSRYPQGQMKIYPIDKLHLGPQIETMKVYKEMINFHEIDSKDEAFITGRMGKYFDTEFINEVLKVAKENKSMVEVEEYLGEWFLHNEIKGIEYEGTESIGMEEWDEFKLKETPPYELHLGFNIPKGGTYIPLNELMEKCKAALMKNGGWFIFKNDKEWHYRSNEFSYYRMDISKNMLFEQALFLFRYRRST